MNKFRIAKLSFIFFFIISRFAVYAQSAKFDDSIYEINRYVTSAKFYKIRLQNGELASVDSIYKFALKRLDNDYSETLLSLTFALLPFDKMELSLPFGEKLTLHLPSVEKELFARRKESLPRGFLPDSPHSLNSDKDKLSHFFGNAFLGYNFPYENISEFSGLFVESFEDTFKIKGAFDERDLKINRCGFLFGKTLRKNIKIFPSEFIMLYFLTFIELQ